MYNILPWDEGMTSLPVQNTDENTRRFAAGSRRSAHSPSASLSLRYEARRIEPDPECRIATEHDTLCMCGGPQGRNRHEISRQALSAINSIGPKRANEDGVKLLRVVGFCRRLVPRPSRRKMRIERSCTQH